MKFGVWLKKIKIKFYSKPVYGKKYLKTKVTKYDGAKITNILVNLVPKEHMYYSCIACIIIDSVIKMEKKNYPDPQVYIEECKYKIRKIQMSRFSNTELDSDSESGPDLVIKVESDSDSE